MSSSKPPSPSSFLTFSSIEAKVWPGANANCSGSTPNWGGSLTTWEETFGRGRCNFGMLKVCSLLSRVGAFKVSRTVLDSDEGSARAPAPLLTLPFSSSLWSESSPFDGSVGTRAAGGSAGAILISSSSSESERPRPSLCLRGFEGPSGSSKTEMQLK